MADVSGATTAHNALVAYGEWYAQYAEYLGHMDTKKADKREYSRAQVVEAIEGMVKSLCVLRFAQTGLDAQVREWSAKGEQLRAKR